MNNYEKKILNGKIDYISTHIESILLLLDDSKDFISYLQSKGKISDDMCDFTNQSEIIQHCNIINQELDNIRNYVKNIDN